MLLSDEIMRITYVISINKRHRCMYVLKYVVYNYCFIIYKDIMKNKIIISK